MINQQQMPLFSTIKEFQKANPVSFHVPGHKHGKLFPEEAKQWFQSLLSLDVTELTGLDDLHDPKGPIAQAQQLAAELYKVEKSFFLVGGSTVGNLAMILSVCQEGDFVLVQRNCHKSVMNGIRLAKALPIFLHPEYDEDLQLYTGVGVASVKRAIEMYPMAKALILTSPSYYGVSNPIKEIIEEAHAAQIPVLVDEAHGAHFVIGDPFPKSAIEEGADIIVQSAHKTLPAMTMASFLHVNSKLVQIDKIKRNLEVLQSSSPSYPLMISLDIARYYVANIDEQKKKAIINSINELKSKLAEIKQLNIVEQRASKITLDPLKIIVETNCTLNGFQLQKLLEEEFIYTELADDRRVLIVLGLNPVENIDNLIDRIKQKLGSFPLKRWTNYHPGVTKSISKWVLSYKEMEEIPKTVIPLEKAIGMIAAANVVPYPPGIPLLLNGEEIEKNHIDNIVTLAKSGATFQGSPFILETGIEVFSSSSKRGKQ